MAIFNGKKLNIEIYGESHAEKIGVKVKGLPKFNYDEFESAPLGSRAFPGSGSH